MRLSLITVARNAGATIGDTMSSVGRQSMLPAEHLLIDGASTDRTVAIARASASHPLTVVSEPDSGLYDAMNKGVRLASGDIVGLLNADDIFAHEGVLGEIVTTLERNSDAAGCYADLVYVDRFNPAKVVRHWRSRPYEPGLFARGWVPPHPTLYLRREVYEKIGGFDLSYRLAADFEFMLRLFEKHEFKLLHLPQVWVRMRLGGATSRDARNVIAGNREIARALRSQRVGWPPFTQTCRMLRRLPQFFSKPS